MNLNLLALVIGVCVGILIWIVSFNPIFGSGEGFSDCVGAFFSDPFLLFGYDYDHYLWSELKLGFWVVSGGVVGFVVTWGLRLLFSQ